MPLNTAQTQPPEWMVIFSTHDLNEAHIIAGRLHVEGIRAMVLPQAGASAFGLTVGQLGQVNVLVSQDAYPLALAILEADDPLALLDGDEDASLYYDEDGNLLDDSEDELDE